MKIELFLMAPKKWKPGELESLARAVGEKLPKHDLASRYRWHISIFSRIVAGKIAALTGMTGSGIKAEGFGGDGPTIVVENPTKFPRSMGKWKLEDIAFFGTCEHWINSTLVISPALRDFYWSGECPECSHNVQELLLVEGRLDQVPEPSRE